MAIPSYFRSDGWVKSVLGQAVSGAMIFVLNQPANTVAPVNTKGVPQPFTPNPQQQIYSDPFGLSPITQPVFTDGFGHYDFYVAPGTYTIAIYLGSVVSPFAVYPDQTFGLSASSLSVSSLNGLTGAVSITAGSNITVNVLGSSIQISSTASGGVSSWSGDGSLFTNSSSIGAVTAVLGTQSANTVFAGPTSGGAHTPTFRSLAAADIPSLSYLPLAGGTLTGNLTLNAELIDGSGSQGTSGQVLSSTGTKTQWVNASSGSAFSALTTGTNTTATMTVGSGASIVPSGTGLINSTEINGVSITGTPTVGQVPTATSGTAATWQTPSGGSGSYIKLSETILASDTATVTFSSISGSYRHLKLFVTARESGTGYTFYMQFNGDNGNNYSSVNAYGGTGSGNTTNYSTNSAPAGMVATSSDASNNAAGSEVTIFDYARTAWNKTFIATTSSPRQSTTLYTLTFAGEWNNTAAINQIVLALNSGGNFLAGSVFSLYGIQ